MKSTIKLLQEHPQVSDYKINVHEKESCELFFVKGKLETLRRTDTCDKDITVYVDHGEYKGEAQFRIYPSTTEEQISEHIQKAVGKALLINNKTFTLPEGEEGDYEVRSNFSEYAPMELAATIAKTVFEANEVEKAGLNSVEIFIDKHRETVYNSNGLRKTQVRYRAMVEAIPTYNGETQSVELYEQYNFGSLDEAALGRQIAGRMEEVKARYEAVKPDFAIDCPVILNKMELLELFWSIVDQLNYATVYSESGIFQKGDLIQKAPKGDAVGITMAGEAAGSVASAKFDRDGLSLDKIRLVEDGKVLNFFGTNRYGQYLGEKPTGDLRCLCVDAGTADEEVFGAGPHLEILSMSGLQVDFYNDYIGGEVRLAYYHDGERSIPVTGLSVSGSLNHVLEHIRLSSRLSLQDSYYGPEKALLKEMKVF